MHLDLSEEEASALHNRLSRRAYRSAMIAGLWTTVASGKETPSSYAPAAGWRDRHVVGQTVAIAPEGTPPAAGCSGGWTGARVCANHHGVERLPIGRPTCSDKGSDYGL